MVGISTSAANANAEESPGVGNAFLQEEKVALGPAPNDFGLKYDYYTDCSLVCSFSTVCVLLFFYHVLSFQRMKIEHHYPLWMSRL